MRAGAVVVFYLHGQVRVEELAPGASVVIGRGAPATVVLADPSLSRQHAMLRNDGTHVTLHDLGSRNGTFVNGERVDGEMQMHSGMEFCMGAVLGQLRIAGSVAANALGLETYDAFLSRLSEELIRARAFTRPVSILMIRGSNPHPGGVLAWCGRLRQALRPVDRLASYGHSAALVLLPELGPELAYQCASNLVLQGPQEVGLVCGVASFPNAARTRDEMLSVVLEAARSANLEQRIIAAQGTRAVEITTAQEIVVRSPRMIALYELVRRAAPTCAPVLVRGETGVGKELVATALHMQGPRRDKPLRIVNCGALPPTLTEGLLFGHERGVYTGADKRRKGIFEQADGGTVFLDEVGELSPGAQAALLRVLETKRVTRLGATEELEVDVRIVAATNCDLAAMIGEKRFRADLLYRLNTLTLDVPTLRDRPEDIAPLAELFLRRASRDWKMPATKLHPDALQRLLQYAWPGNIRELRNAIERAVILGQAEEILLEHLPEELREGGAPPARSTGQPHSDEQQVEHADTSPPSAGLRSKVRNYEAELINEALRETGGNRSRAAALLGMPLRTLTTKIRIHIRPQRAKPGADTR